MCNACDGTSVDPGERKREEWARAAAERDVEWARRPCEFCGAIAGAGAACGTCGRPRTVEVPVEPVPAPVVRDEREGERKREEWARLAAERDVEWARQPCAYCGAIAGAGAACGTCGRPRSVAQPVEPAAPCPVRDDREGDRMRAEWARAAAERDAEWARRPCEYCGAAVDGAACGTCGRPRSAPAAVQASVVDNADDREERDALQRVRRHLGRGCEARGVGACGRARCGVEAMCVLRRNLGRRRVRDLRSSASRASRLECT